MIDINPRSARQRMPQMGEPDKVPLSAGLIELAVIGWLFWGCAAYGIVLLYRAMVG